MFINRNLVLIVIFLFSMGLIIQISRSDFILQLNSADGPTIERAKLVTSSAENELQAIKVSKSLIITDPNEEGSSALQQNLEQQLAYMKKSYDTVDYTSIPSSFSNYESIMIAFADINKLGDMKKYEDFVEQGGGLFLAIRPELGPSLYQIYRKLGIYELGDHITTYGIKIEKDILVNATGIEIKEKTLTTNASIAVQLENEADLYLTSSEGTPIMWRNQVGKGRIMVFNGTMLMGKESRGLIAGAISHLSDTYVYPIFNSKIVYLDDFPAPVPSGTNEKIYKEYGKDIRSFYQDVWWKDMLKAAAKYDLKYTAVLIENYNNQVQPPFTAQVGTDYDSMIQYGREILKMEGEVGIHGYNHQSLTEFEETSEAFGYNNWNSKEDMVASLIQSNKFLQETLPNYKPITYVPPSNVLSEMGKQALKEAIPSIKVISSLYLEDASEMAYIQEFESNKDFIELPRITSGYHENDETIWSILNGTTSIGMFSHFIHPDDILDEVRGKSSTWKEMNEDYNKVLTLLQDKYPWLESKVSSQAAVDLENYEKTEVYLDEQENQTTIYLNHFAPPFTFVLYSEKTITDFTGGTYEKIGDQWYLLSIQKEKATIKFQ